MPEAAWLRFPDNVSYAVRLARLPAHSYQKILLQTFRKPLSPHIYYRYTIRQPPPAHPSEFSLSAAAGSLCKSDKPTAYESVRSFPWQKYKYGCPVPRFSYVLYGKTFPSVLGGSRHGTRWSYFPGEFSEDAYRRSDKSFPKTEWEHSRSLWLLLCPLLSR